MINKLKFLIEILLLKNKIYNTIVFILGLIKNNHLLFKQNSNYLAKPQKN